MSDNTPSHTFSPKLPEGAPAAQAGKSAVHSTSRTMRETVESIVVAFILAFLFRTFEAEAFVIPTGSMAPTLQGRHKDFTCPECKYRYRVNASGEVEDESSVLEFKPQNGGRGGDPRAGKMVFSGLCPMCRFPVTELDKNPSYNGDRILVGKFPYDFADPERWDVVVFKYPGDAKTNFIKRLVGLPKETVRIQRGDLYVKPEGAGDDEFTIARKPPDKVQAMLQEVYSSDYPAPDLEKRHWPARWQPWPAGAPGGWTTDNGGRSFRLAGGGGEHWLRYQHILPTWRDWSYLKAKRGAAGGDPTLSDRMRPQLITDFYAYNTGRSRNDYMSNPNPRVEMLGLHWVGDLAVDCTLDVAKARGAALFDLVEGGQHFRCTIDLSSGEAALGIDGVGEFAPKAQTSVRGPGQYKICFANVDDQLLLWVDGKVADFDQPTSYDQFDLGNGAPMSTPQDLGDLAPVGVGGKDAELTARHLRVRRDIYYIAGRNFGGLLDYDVRASNLRELNAETLADLMSDPNRWSVFHTMQSTDYPLGDDQFFVLGDNSPYSKDSRLWSEESLPGALWGHRRLGHYVDRDLLVGKALFIYWPHTDHEIPGTSIPFPFFPNFAKMGFVR
jgi:signal peptidase I